jgi:uncharacterized protein YkwD
MARAAPPITLVVLLAACLGLVALAAAAASAAAPASAAKTSARGTRAAARPGAPTPSAGAAKRSARGTHDRARPGAPTRSGSAARADVGTRASRPAAAAARRRRAVRERRCSAAGIRALRGTSRVERRVRCIVNRRRASAGLQPLRYDRCLDRAAEGHARDMVRRHYFAHTSRGGRNLVQRVRAAGYVRRAGHWRLGENLAWGAGRRSTARSIVHGWMNSPPHRANILARGFRDVGVAVVRGAPVRGRASASGARRSTFVVEFGARQPGRCQR